MSNNIIVGTRVRAAMTSKPRNIRVDRCKPTRRIVAGLSVAVAEVRSQFINTNLSSLLRSM